MHDPQTPDEWQEAVNAAHFFVLVEAARQHRLIEHAPPLNLQRCQEILRRGRELGIVPEPDVIERGFTEAQVRTINEQIRRDADGDSQSSTHRLQSLERQTISDAVRPPQPRKPGHSA